MSYTVVYHNIIIQVSYSSTSYPSMWLTSQNPTRSKYDIITHRPRIPPSRSMKGLLQSYPDNTIARGLDLEVTGIRYFANPLT